MLTSADLRNVQFAVTRHRPGYDQREVDAFLAQVEAGALTPADVRSAQFAVTRHRPGYDQREVDTFLDQIEAGLESTTLSAAVLPPSGILPGPVTEKAGSSSQTSTSGFVRLLVLALFFAVVAIGPGIGFASSYSAFERSSYTQASGIPDSATVISERVGTGKAAETDVMVRLDTPVGGRDTSVVNIAGAHSYAAGQRVSVLVDPRDPSYSELPGIPDDLPLETLVATGLLIVLLTAAVVASVVAAFRKLLRRGRGGPGQHYADRKTTFRSE